MLVDVEKENLCVPTNSKEVLQAPEYKERMMIKKEEHRKRMAYEQVFEITEEMINVDPGIAAVKEYFEGIKLVTEDDEETAKEYFGPIIDVGKSTSTIGLIQKI